VEYYFRMYYDNIIIRSLSIQCNFIYLNYMMRKYLYLNISVTSVLHYPESEFSRGLGTFESSKCSGKL
jgi:hypothetical protein